MVEYKIQTSVSSATAADGNQKKFNGQTYTELEAALNAVGKDGWELVTVLPVVPVLQNAGVPPMSYYVFKRTV